LRQLGVDTVIVLVNREQQELIGRTGGRTDLGQKVDVVAQGRDIDIQLFGQLGDRNTLTSEHGRNQIQQATETGSSIHGD
jgi:hypothetical protein